MTDDRGGLLFEYRPPAAHPIFYAGIILFTAVFVMGSIENIVRGAKAEIFAWYALPVLVTGLVMVAFRLGPVRIHQNGIAPARPLIARWHRPFVHWDELAAIYPSYYDVTGAFVSPFASSDGKVTQMGLGLEWPDGRVETVRFTPTRFTIWKPESKGYKGAMDAVRQAWGDRPLVPAAETFTAEEAETMATEAKKPFLPFFAIVFLFASAAPVLWLLLQVPAIPVWAALALSLIAPIGVSLRSWMQSQRRHAILNRLSKAAEFERGRQEASA